MYALGKCRAQSGSRKKQREARSLSRRRVFLAGEMESERVCVCTRWLLCFNFVFARRRELSAIVQLRVLQFLFDSLTLIIFERIIFHDYTKALQNLGNKIIHP